MIYEPKNIIVKMPNWLGDAVMATPILADLRKKWPKSKITAMCQSNIASLYNVDPNINEIFSYTKPSGWIHRTGHIDVIEPLRLGEYDLGVLLTNSFSSAYWFWRGKVKDRLGYAMGLRKFLLTIPVSKPPSIEKQHLVLTYKELLLPLNIPISKTQPKLYLSLEEKYFAEELLSSYGISKNMTVVGINPGAAYGSAKCWLPERFEEVTRKLLEKPDLFVVYFGDLNGKALVDKICLKMPKRVINLAGKTKLRELMALINACTVFLTNDSGPMHIASALEVPLLALFGSTNEIKTGPYNGGRVIHKHVECSPCYLRKCPKKDFPCMTEIQPDEVYREIKRIVEKGT